MEHRTADVSRCCASVSNTNRLLAPSIMGHFDSSRNIWMEDGYQHHASRISSVFSSIRLWKLLYDAAA